MCSNDRNVTVISALPCRLQQAHFLVDDLEAELCKKEELLRQTQDASGERAIALRGQQANLGHLMDEVQRRLDHVRRHGGDTDYLQRLLATAHNRSVEVFLEQQTM